MKKRLLPALQALLAALLFGVSAPLSKLLLKDVEAVPLAGLLYLGSGCGALMFIIVERSRRDSGRLGGKTGQAIEARLTWGEIPGLAGAIFVGGVAAPILLLIGLQRTPASSASLLLNFEAVGTTLLAVLLFREAVDKRILWAVGLITLASILLALKIPANGTPDGTAFGFSLGALGILAACLLWGLDNNLTRTISAKDPLVIVTWKGLGAGGFSLLLARISGMPVPRLSIILMAMLLGSLSYGLSIRLFILALRALGAARTSALFGTAPFAGSLLSLFLFHEYPGWLFWVSIPVMLAGAWLMLSEKHLHTHVHEPQEHSHRHSHPDEHHAHSHTEDQTLGDGEHVHWHRHDTLEHAHPHTPDIHHRHEHKKG